MYSPAPISQFAFAGILKVDPREIVISVKWICNCTIGSHLILYLDNIYTKHLQYCNNENLKKKITLYV